MTIRELTISVAAASVVALALAGTAAADENELSKYQPTGEKRQCIATYMIHNTDVIDNENIVFRINGGEYYLNHLPHKCSGLKIQDGFTYTLRGLNELCNVDVITPVSTGGAIYAPCPLGDFQKVNKVKTK
ncbi:MAG: hypothetical protein GC201_02695 [Alphaproteobacteria bacterium]|nr:hypothetical protein [Alphaproteobacteria bacterium]